VTRLALAAALLAAFISACSSPEERLIDRRTRLREMLDELHESYSQTLGRSPPIGDQGVVGRFIEGVERAQFDEYCLAIGRGERPFALSGRLEAFMKERDHARTCRKAAETQLEVAKLEAELRPR
jgi:hypothetical protein